MAIKNRLSQILGERRMAIAELCRQSGISRVSADGMFQDGNTRVDLPNLEKILRFLEVDVRDFFYLDPPLPSASLAPPSAQRWAQNLAIIEGVAEEDLYTLYGAGILTFRDLADRDPEDILQLFPRADMARIEAALWQAARIVESQKRQGIVQAEELNRLRAVQRAAGRR